MEVFDRACVREREREMETMVMTDLDAWDFNEIDGKACGGVDARERHERAERERRKSMRELLLARHSLLPNAHNVRKEQSAILDEVIKFIPVAVLRLRTLQARDVPAHTATVQRSSFCNSNSGASSGDCHIRVCPDSFSAVSIRVRGNRVNVSLTDTQTALYSILLSQLLDELESHRFKLAQSTHCRDGSKLFHHSESKICNGMEESPSLFKARMHEFACKLHRLRKSTTKRSFDQLD